MKRTKMVICALTMTLFFGGCAGRERQTEEKLQEWLAQAELDDTYTAAELYEAALSEGTLVVYSVSGRVFQAKEDFEREYPGLTVEIKDIRSNDVVKMLRSNYEEGDYACDVVICSDCDGSFYQELIQKGIIYTYVPWDIAPHMKEGCADPELDFLGEAMMLFYNTSVSDGIPIDNIWELTGEQYRGKIMMPNPLSSFSTYGFCAQTLHEDEALRRAYEAYAGEPLAVPEGKTAGMVFWEKLAANLVFVNSNDEVLEGVGNSSDVLFGIMISSKLRYRDLGYHFAPVTSLVPFCSVYTPNNIALAGGSENVNGAKLFIRYILGEADGTAKGAAAFSTEGSWSTRSDMPDGSSIPLSGIDMIRMDKAYLYKNRDAITEFFGGLVERTVSER